MYFDELEACMSFVKRWQIFQRRQQLSRLLEFSNAVKGKCLLLKTNEF